MVLHVDAQEPVHGPERVQHSYDVGQAELTADGQAHLRQLEADVDVETAPGERRDRVHVCLDGGYGLLHVGHRFPQDVDGRS